MRSTCNPHSQATRPEPDKQAASTADRLIFGLTIFTSLYLIGHLVWAAARIIP